MNIFMNILEEINSAKEILCNLWLISYTQMLLFALFSL